MVSTCTHKNEKKKKQETHKQTKAKPQKTFLPFSCSYNFSMAHKEKASHGQFAKWTHKIATSFRGKLKNGTAKTDFLILC